MISSLTLKLNNFIRNEKVKETTERGTEFTKVNEYGVRKLTQNFEVYNKIKCSLKITQ